MPKIFYHNDADGRCSAAIAYRYFNRECELHEIDYTMEFDFSIIKPDDVVYMIDYCLEPFDLMLKLNASCKLIWIDHHISAIEEEEHSEQKIQGIRNNNHAACMLSWYYFFPFTPAPWAVKYVEDIDIWKWEFEDYTRLFYAGLELHDFTPKSNVWDVLFSSNSAEFENSLIRDGHVVDKYKTAFWREIVKAFGFPLTFEGHENCYACNQGKCGTALFKSLEQAFDIVIPFVYDGKSKLWRVSMFSKTVDVSVIAKKYGGGGHKRAAGFETKTFPFA